MAKKSFACKHLIFFFFKRFCPVLYLPHFGLFCKVCEKFSLSRCEEKESNKQNVKGMLSMELSRLALFEVYCCVKELAK